VADHARSLRYLDDVRAVVAEAVQRGFCAIDAIADELHAGRRNGSALLRRAVHDVTLGAASAPEARAASLLRAAPAPAFEQNAAVIGGARRYVADFLWRELQAILEIDSRDYHFSPRDWQATLRRHAELETGGYSVIHIVPSELRDADDFIRRVRRWLTATHSGSARTGQRSNGSTGSSTTRCATPQTASANPSHCAIYSPALGLAASARNTD